jgi:hypothetical protein
MGFGAPTGKIDTTTSNTVETAEKRDENGKITEMTTFGGIETKTETEFTDSFTNACTNGQTGTTSTGVITENTYVETNDDYARETTVTVKPLA